MARNVKQLKTRPTTRRISIINPKLRFGITGTPGTGKKSVGRALAQITGLKFESINEIAMRRKVGRWDGEDFVVNVTALKGKIETEGKILCGHLLPYAVSKKELDCVAILRCSPAVLKKRLAARGYSEAKIEENVESEMLDLVAGKALSVYGRRKVCEFDTSRTKPVTVAVRILQVLEGKKPRPYGVVNWAERASESPEALKKVTKQWSAIDRKG